MLPIGTGGCFDVAKIALHGTPVFVVVVVATVVTVATVVVVVVVVFVVDFAVATVLIPVHPTVVRCEEAYAQFHGIAQGDGPQVQIGTQSETIPESKLGHGEGTIGLVG